jgi:hypothetical protein
MPMLGEMLAWSLEEIHAEILAMLPEGWTFDFHSEHDAWVACFVDAGGVRLWRGTNVTAQALLLDAFGWLWKPLRPAAHPAWVLRSHRSLTPVHRVGLPGLETPELEDLDPEEIDAVYSGHTNR